MSPLSYQTSVTVEQDESLVSAGLLQVTRRYVLIGIEAQEHLSTDELLLRPGARDIKYYELDAPDRGWQYLDFTLEDNQEILVFKLDVKEKVLAVATWFDEPEKEYIRMRLQVVHFDSMTPICPISTFDVPWKREDERQESPVAFIELHGDLVGLRVHEVIHQSHLRVWNFRTGRLLMHHVCSRGEEGTSFAFVSDQTIAVANRLVGAIDLIPITPMTSQHIHRLQLAPSALPYNPAPNPSQSSSPSPVMLGACFAGADIILVQFTAPDLGQRIDLVITRDALVKHSAEVVPSFPMLSIDQLVDGNVIVPWGQWNAEVKVFPIWNTPSHRNQFSVDGNWIVRHSVEAGRERFKILDFDFYAGGKTLLDEALEYSDIIVVSASKRILGLKFLEYGDKGDSSLDALDVYLLN